MNEVKKTDLIYLQNEILKDIATIDKKYSDKITQLTTALKNFQLMSDQKFALNNDKYESLLKKLESNEEIKKIKKEFSDLKKDINQNQMLNNNKLFNVEKDLKNACYRYDDLLSNNIFTPGLIGKGGKYQDLKTFRTHIDKKIAELVIYKEKNILDMKKFKEKTETAINQFNLRSESSENKYFEFCSNKINEAKLELMDKFNILEECINNLKIENGKYSYDLIKKSEDLQNQLNILKNLEDNINNKLKEQAEQYKSYNDDILKLFDSQNEEFKLIKSRFTELSEFIKDVRFVRNLDNYKAKSGQNTPEINTYSLLRTSKKISRKINFDKPQSISKNDEIKINMNNDNNIIKIENNKESGIINNQSIKEENMDNNEISNNSIIINDDYIENNKNNENQIEQKEKEKNKEKIKYNIKFNIKEKESNLNLNNLNLNSRNNRIKTENNIINSSIKKNSNNNTLISFINSSQKKNIEKESFLTRTSQRRKIELTDDKDEFRGNKSDIYFYKQNKTQENFNKNKNLKLKKINQNFFNENSYYLSPNKTKEVKEFIFDKDDIKNNNNLINENNNNDDKIYEYIDSKILEINKKIKEMQNNNRYLLEKMNKKIDLFVNLNNVLLLKLKNTKSLTSKQINILTNYEFSIPLLNNNNDKNKMNGEKIKAKSKESSSIAKINDFFQSQQNSAKILKMVEPYLIKKFRSDSINGTNNK